MIGKAKAVGAISVVNALASGRGATLAVNLPTFARVSVNEKRGRWHVFVNGARVKSPLAVQTVHDTVKMFGEEPGKFSGVVETKTSVPIGVGLKSSSSSSVAIALAVLAAFGEKSYNADQVLNISATSSLKAGVSLTGALDDAASCLIGGVNFTDNSAMQVLSSSRLGRSWPVLIRIPRGTSRRAKVARSKLRRFSKVADSIFSMGLEGRIWKAMTLNGLLYCSIYGYPPDDSMEALEANALGSGLSGTGPAVGAVFDEKRDLERVAAKWKQGGARLVRTETTDVGGTIGF